MRRRRSSGDHPVDEGRTRGGAERDEDPKNRTAGGVGRAGRGRRGARLRMRRRLADRREHDGGGTTAGPTTASTNGTCAVTPDRDGRALPVADGHVPQRHPRGQAGHAADADHQGREREQRLRAGRGGQRRDLARGRRGRLLAVRHAAASQTFLRGIQTTNANGEVVFTTIYPGWYQGRATHIHVEVTDRRRLAQGHADRVPRGRQRRRAPQRRLRLARHEPHLERGGRHLRGQPGAPRSSRRRAIPSTRVCRDVPDRHRGLTVRAGATLSACGARRRPFPVAARGHRCAPAAAGGAGDAPVPLGG